MSLERATMAFAGAMVKELRTVLDEHYPFDRARGYAPGDVHGAFSVTWPGPEVVR